MSTSVVVCVVMSVLLARWAPLLDSTALVSDTNGI
jgi:hypothetical protein